MRILLGLLFAAGMVHGQQPVGQPGQPTYKVTYTGGTLRVKAGSGMKLTIDRDQIQLGANVVQPSSVTSINYSQDASRIFVPGIGVPGAGAIGGSAIAAGIGALGSLARSAKHYIGLRWDRGESVRRTGDTFDSVRWYHESIVLQAGSGDWRAIVADLEGASGLRLNESRRP